MKPEEPERKGKPRIAGILEDYLRRISEIGLPAPHSGPGAEQEYHGSPLSEDFAAAGKKISSELRQRRNAIRKITEKVESGLARLPASPGAEDGGVSEPDAAAPHPHLPRRPQDSRAADPASGGEKENSPARRVKPRATAVSLLLLAAALGIGVSLYMKSAPAHSAFPLPHTRTAGLAIKGRLLLSADPQRGLLFAVAAENGRIKTARKFPGQGTAALAWGGDCLWSADTGRIYQHGGEPDYAIRRTFASPGRNPSAIYWDGEFLWTGDRLSGTISRYAPGDSLSPAGRYALPGAVPAGFYVSDGLLWILDSVTNRVARYRPESVLKPVDSMEMGAMLPAGSRTTGFAVDSSNLWVITENPAELHRFGLKFLRQKFILS